MTQSCTCEVSDSLWCQCNTPQTLPLSCCQARTKSWFWEWWGCQHEAKRISLESFLATSAGWVINVKFSISVVPCLDVHDRVEPPHAHRVFAGNYRRKLVGSNMESSFFDPLNEEGAAQRAQCAQLALEDMVGFLRSGGEVCYYFASAFQTRTH